MSFHSRTFPQSLNAEQTKVRVLRGGRAVDRKLQLTMRFSAVGPYVSCRVQALGTPTVSGNTRGVSGAWGGEGGGFKAEGAM